MTGRLVRIVAAVFAFTFAFGIIAAPPLPPLRAADDAARPAEFAVLDRWLGEWDLEMTIKPNRQNPQGRKATYQSTVRWTLNDRFLRCEGQGQGMDGDRNMAQAFMWNITFDTQAGKYISATLWSNVTPGTSGYWGGGQRGVGTWDEKEQIMTIRTEDKEGGLVTLSVTQWIDKDNHRWVESTTQKDGNVVLEISGVGKRRK